MSNEVLIQKILSLREEKRQLELQEEELETRIEAINAQIEEGINVLMGMDLSGKPVDVTRIMQR